MSVSDSRALQREKRPQAGDGGCQDSGLGGPLLPPWHFEPLGPREQRSGGGLLVLLGLIGPSRQGEVVLLVHRVAGRYAGSGPSWHCGNSHRKASENCRGYSEEVVDWRVEAGGAEQQLRPGDQPRHRAVRLPTTAQM